MKLIDPISILPAAELHRRFAAAPGMRHLEPLYRAARTAWYLAPHVRVSAAHGIASAVPEFTVAGDAGGHVPVRVGILAGFARDRFDTVEATARLLLRVSARPAEIDGVHLHVFPLVNRTVLEEYFGAGFHETGWNELTRGGYVQPVDVLITITATSALPHLVARVNDIELADAVARPALQAACARLEMDASVHITEAAVSLRELASGVGLASEDDSVEIHLHAPGGAGYEERVEATSVALWEILNRLSIHGLGSRRQR